MPTLATLKARIADEIERADLTLEIANAITDAIAAHESERFWWNESRSITFDTVASQAEYDSSDNAYIPYLVRIDALFFAESDQIFPLDRYAPTDFEVISGGNSSTGKPYTYTYTESTIRLWPTPDDAYSMRLHGVYKLAALTSDSSNAWTTEAEELIRASAKMRLYEGVLSGEPGAFDMARMQAGIVARKLNELRAETSARTGLGKIVPTEF